MDDILIWGTSQQEHNDNLKSILACLQQARFTSNKDKCSFNVTSMEYLGCTISGDGIKVSQRHILVKNRKMFGNNDCF